MELRIMGDSNLIMAPQRGNKHGTASIEVLSVSDVVSDDEWVPFLQRVTDLGMEYRDAEGAELNRPHWAKEWESINTSLLRNTSGRWRIKTLFLSLNMCWRILARLRVWDLDDIQKSFSNELWDYMIYS